MLNTSPPCSPPFATRLTATTSQVNVPAIPAALPVLVNSSNPDPWVQYLPDSSGTAYNFQGKLTFANGDSYVKCQASGTTM